MPDADRTRSSKLRSAVVKMPKTTRFGGRLPTEVTPDTIRTALNAARGGRPSRLFGVLEYFYRNDDEIRGALSSLIEAVLQRDPLVQPVDDSTEARRQEEDITALFQHLDLTELLREGLEGWYYGFNAASLPEWEYFELPNGSRVQGPPTYELLPRDWIYADKERRSDDHTTLFVGDRPYHEYPWGTVLLFNERKLPSFTSVDFTRYGCGVPASRFACFSFFNHEDWSAYNEVFGIPTILGKLLEGWGDDDRKLLEQAVFGIANDARGIITDKGEIDKLTAAAGGEAVFEKADEVWRKARARIIKSESLTDNMGDRGSFAAMVTVNGIRLDIARGIARRVARLLMRRLVRPFCELNYGTCLVTVSMLVKEVKNLTGELAVARGAHEMGLDLSRQELYDRLGFTPPDPDDPDDLLPGRTQGGALGDLSLFGGG